MPHQHHDHAANPNIEKTFLYPVPVELWSQDADPDEVGIATYSGPRYLVTRWDPENPGVLDEIAPQGCSDCQRPPRYGCVEVVLDAEQLPLHALVLVGNRYDEDGCCSPGPERIECVCGDPEAPNPVIADPYHYTEVFNLRSFYYDTEAGNWTTPEFKVDHPDSVFPDQEGCSQGWLNVRHTRNKMLTMSDKYVAGYLSDEKRAEWENYRQKLRDIPQKWADVGNHTSLICWPEMPADENHVPAPMPPNPEGDSRPDAAPLVNAPPGRGA